MTNLQAAWLRPGHRIRRKEPFEARDTVTHDVIYIVERVEAPMNRSEDWTIHAGGQAFKPWEIERVRDEQ